MIIKLYNTSDSIWIKQQSKYVTLKGKEHITQVDFLFANTSKNDCFSKILEAI